MDFSYFIFLSSGLFLGWSLGANDAANIFGTAVGTKMLRFKTAALIASIFVIIGAVYGGGGASQTLSRLGSVDTLAGSFMTALAAAFSVYWMVKSGLPTSTSQAIVGAIIGWNFFAGHSTNTYILGQIVSTWILCPLLSGAIAILLYWLTKYYLRKSRLHILRQDSYTRIGLIIAAAFGAYALGANNIANVMGVFVDSNPFKSFTQQGFVFSSSQILFLLGGLAISCGIFTYSHKVINTIGNNLMSMSPVVAWIVVIAQAIVLFMFSSVSLQNFLHELHLPTLPLVPVSSSQAVIGAIMGIGIAKGGRELNWNILLRVAGSWITTPLFAAVICYISLFFLQNVFGQLVYQH